jgi:pentatricopeptide repeat protein
LPWNLLIRGYAASDSPREAIWVFYEMRRRGIRPNKLTFPFLLKACASVSALGEGRQVHAEVVKCGLDSDVYVQNTLISAYGSCRRIKCACGMFDEMLVRTVVSWNAVITACVENSWLGDGIGYFVKMRDCGFEPDETTMVVMLSACTELGNLSLGRWVHSLVIVKGMVLNYQLGTSLVDMYVKAGNVDYAKLVFDRLDKRNVWTWSAMILGLAQHGFAKEALDLFLKMMKTSSIRPNYVTFLGVLCACTHAGLVSDGYRYFHDMEHVHGIKPRMIHYGAMVDILGRAGHINDAYTFIMNMPTEPDPIVWRTLLCACSIHHVNDHDGVGDKVRKKLLELEPRRGGNFVVVANMYSEVGMWEKAANVRRVMKAGGLKKMAGESCIDLGGSIHRFFSGYDSRADCEGIYELLDALSMHMKMANFL